MRCHCLVAPPHHENLSIQKNSSPQKPPAQPSRSTQCRLHHTRCPLQILQVTLQQPVACSGLATHTLVGLWHCGCRAAPPHLENSSIQQNRTPLKPPAQPGRSTQCRIRHTCCNLQRLHLTLQRSMACPGLATHTLAGLCALQLPNAASSSANLHKPLRSQTPFKPPA